MHNNSYIVFFFSSRRRHTRSLRDWSSDVCSSDLRRGHARRDRGRQLRGGPALGDRHRPGLGGTAAQRRRSEERRVGKECRSRWSPYYLKKKKNKRHRKRRLTRLARVWRLKIGCLV